MVKNINGSISIISIIPISVFNSDWDVGEVWRYELYLHKMSSVELGYAREQNKQNRLNCKQTYWNRIRYVPETKNIYLTTCLKERGVRFIHAKTFVSMFQ